MKCAWTFCFTIHELKISDTVAAPCMNPRWSSWKNTCKYFNILFQQLVRKQQPWKFSNIVNHFQFFPLKMASCFNWRNETQLQINCLNSFCPRDVKKSPIFFGPVQTSNFSEPNLIHWIKYMKNSASESIRSTYFNLERLSRSFCLTRPRISALERLWNSFDSEPNRTFQVPK